MTLAKSSPTINTYFMLYNVRMQETTQRIIQLLGLYYRISWSRNARTRRHSKCYKTKLIERLVLQQKGKIYWPIFQLAELVFFRATVLNKYLLLTEFEGRTVSYGPSFFPFAYGPSAKRAGHKLKGKTRIRNLQYGPRNEVSRIFILSLRLIGRAEKEIF